MTSTLPPLVQAISGAIGSASANTLTYPLDLVTTRVQLASPHRASRSKGKEKDLQPVSKVAKSHNIRVVRILQSIIRSHGVGALYDGLLTDTAGTLVSNFFYFYIYSFLRKFLIRHLTGNRAPSSPTSKPVPSVKLTVWQDLILGFLSGVTSRAISMPLSIVTLRLQTENQDRDETNEEDSEGEGDDASSGLARAVKNIYDEQGLSGFWRGFNTTILLSLNPSITLAFFQIFRRVLALSRPRQGTKHVLDPSPMEAFFGGAISNSIAVAILYPLILSKTRLQASRKSTTLSSTSTSTPTLRTVMLDAYRGRYPSSKSLDSQGADRVTGLKGLYQGLDMQILKGFFSQGVTFLVKGRIEQLIVQAYVRRQLGGGPSDEIRSEFEAWNVIEHFGRRYL